jgi:hypothetical protein
VARSRQWARRHPTVFVSTIVLLVLGVIGLAVTTALVTREQGRTRQAYHRERQRVTEAEERFRLARRSVDEMIRLGEEELADSPQYHTLHKRVLETALVYYQELIELRRDDASALADLAATRDRVQKILADLAIFEGAGQMFLLSEKAVLDDLGLNEESRQQLASTMQRMATEGQELFREFRRLTPAERRERFLTLARRSESAIASVLNAEQLHRLKQISIQQKGAGAFREPEIATALKLTTEQRQTLRAIEFDAHFDHEEESPGDRILAGLTAEQRSRWNEIIGRPYTGPRPRFPPGPPEHNRRESERASHFED